MPSPIKVEATAVHEASMLSKKHAWVGSFSADLVQAPPTVEKKIPEYKPVLISQLIANNNSDDDAEDAEDDDDGGFFTYVDSRDIESSTPFIATSACHLSNTGRRHASRPALPRARQASPLLMTRLTQTCMTTMNSLPCRLHPCCCRVNPISLDLTAFVSYNQTLQ